VIYPGWRSQLTERISCLTGLGVLCLCVAKVPFLDVLGSSRARPILHLIIVGAAWVFVSFLYTRIKTRANTSAIPNERSLSSFVFFLILGFRARRPLWSQRRPKSLSRFLPANAVLEHGRDAQRDLSRPSHALITRCYPTNREIVSPSARNLPLALNSNAAAYSRRKKDWEVRHPCWKHRMPSRPSSPNRIPSTVLS